MIRSVAILPFLLGLAPLCAQSVTVVPASMHGAEAPGLAFWALSPFEARRQLLIDADRLGGAPRTFSALEVRRDAVGSATASALQLRMLLSSSLVPATSASETFAANRGPTPVVVFDGRVDLPDAPALPGGVGPAPWTAPWALRLPFRTPYLHASGTLVIETETRPATDPRTGRRLEPFWPIDAIVDAGGGVTNVFGRSCIDDGGDFPAWVEPSGQRPGLTGHFGVQSGENASGIAALILDTGELPNPIDLGPLGADGCDLHVFPRLTIPAPIFAPSRLDDASFASAALAWPRQPSLQGIRFVTQWIVATPGANPLEVETSNAAAVILGPPPSFAGTAWIEATDLGAARGERLPGRFPVLRLHR